LAPRQVLTSAGFLSGFVSTAGVSTGAGSTAPSFRRASPAGLASGAGVAVVATGVASFVDFLDFFTIFLASIIFRLPVNYGLWHWPVAPFEIQYFILSALRLLLFFKRIHVAQILHRPSAC